MFILYYIILTRDYIILKNKILYIFILFFQLFQKLFICKILVLEVSIYNLYIHNLHVRVWLKHLSQHLSQLLARHGLRVGLGHSAIHGLQHPL